MGGAIYVELDLFAALVLLIIMDKSRSFLLSKKERIFRRVLVSTLIVLIFDASTWLFNGMRFEGAENLNLIANYLYWFVSLFPCYLGLMYCCYEISPNLYEKTKVLFSLPIWLGAALLIANQSTGWIFTITSENLYQRGQHFLLVGALPFLHMGLAITLMAVVTIRSPKHQRKQYEMLALFMSIPLWGSLLQIFVYGLITIWPGLTLTILISYVYFQKGNLSLDSLTGTNNRRRFDDYCGWKWRNLGSEDSLFLVVLDINDFKSINDTYGHAEGDAALIRAAETLKKVMAHGKGFLARIGGDEFAIVLNNVSEDVVALLVSSIKEQIQEENLRADKPYRISFAIGYAGTYGKQKVDFKKFFSDADHAMYAHKRSFKQAASTEQAYAPSPLHQNC